MTVWILQTGEPLHVDAGNPRPMRAMNLANALVSAGHRVVLWSSAFYHQEKRHRTKREEHFTISSNLEIRLIPSVGYKRNVGPDRLLDHAILARNLARALRAERAVPDVAFVGYPPIETAAVMARWLKKHRVPFIVDVKDQWPALFLDPLPEVVKPIGRAALSPYYYYGHRAMRDATGLSSMAESFLEWSLEFAGRARRPQDVVAPLVAPTQQVPASRVREADAWWDAQGMRASVETFRIMFVGSHSTAFDFSAVAEAAMAFAHADQAVEFVLCGDGPVHASVRAMMAELPNVRFPGWVDFAQIHSLASRSQLALAPYRGIDNFTKNLPNKVIDSLSLGVPIASPLAGEVANLLSTHGVGLSYGAVSGRSLVECIEQFRRDPGMRREMARRARALYDERFSYEKVYGDLVRHLERLSTGDGR